MWNQVSRSWRTEDPLFEKTKSSISEKFKKLVIQISLKLVLVDWWTFLRRVTVSPVYHNFNLPQLLLSSVLNIIVFGPLFPFIIVVIKFTYFLFLGWFAFSFWIHHGFYFWVKESLVFDVWERDVFSGLFSKAFWCFWSWEYFSTSLFALRPDPSSPVGWVGDGFVEFRFGQLHELAFIMFNGIFFGWKECLGGGVKMVGIAQVL